MTLTWDIEGWLVFFQFVPVYRELTVFFSLFQFIESWLFLQFVPVYRKLTVFSSLFQFIESWLFFFSVCSSLSRVDCFFFFSLFQFIESWLFFPVCSSLSRVDCFFFSVCSSLSRVDCFLQFVPVYRELTVFFLQFVPVYRELTVFSSLFQFIESWLFFFSVCSSLSRVDCFLQFVPVYRELTVFSSLFQIIESWLFFFFSLFQFIESWLYFQIGVVGGMWNMNLLRSYCSLSDARANDDFIRCTDLSTISKSISWSQMSLLIYHSRAGKASLPAISPNIKVSNRMKAKLSHYSGSVPCKLRPADLAVLGSSPACGKDLFNRKRGSVAHNLSLSLIHRPSMTEILLERRKLASLSHTLC